MKEIKKIHNEDVESADSVIEFYTRSDLKNLGKKVFGIDHLVEHLVEIFFYKIESPGQETRWREKFRLIYSSQ